jgi:MscS family membrane protein
MDFWQQVFLDNTVKAYSIAAGTILAALLLKKFLSRYIAGLLYRLLKRVWGNVEKKHFIGLVVQPLQVFLLVLIVVLAIDQLNFPAAWQHSLYGVKTQALAERSGMALLIVAFTWLLLRLIDFAAMVLEHKANLTEDQTDNQLIVFFKDFFKVLLAIAGLLAILKFCFNQAIGPLVAGLGIAGAGIALASKESLENIIASFIIFFDKPFTTGDTLKVHDVTGVVEKIGLRSTRIRTADKTLVSVPNKQMVDSIVDNHSLRTQHRASLQLLLHPHTKAAELQTLVQQITGLLASKGEQIHGPAVFVKDIAKTGIALHIEYFSPPMEGSAFEALRQELNLGIKEILEANKIIFAP